VNKRRLVEYDQDVERYTSDLSAEHTCRKKKKYENVNSALNFAAAYKLHVYCCPKCDGLHLTSSPSSASVRAAVERRARLEDWRRREPLEAYYLCGNDVY
jgi:hypothetical protein